MSTPRAPVADADLMRRAQSGDSDAFGVLYDRLGTRAYRLAYAIARDDSRAEDIVQEAFMSVWRSRASYRPEAGSVVGWVLGTVRHRAIDAVRVHSRHDSRRAYDDQLDQQVPEPGNLEETAAERDQAAQLRDTLARLPAAQRDVITLAYFGELSASEIADELSLPLGTVKGRMRLGLNKLRADAES